MLMVNKGILVMMMANLLTITLVAHLCSALSVKVRRCRVVMRRQVWGRIYLRLSLAIVSISFLLMLSGTFSAFQRASFVAYEADRKACVIIAWLLELTGSVLYWRFVAWRSFQEKLKRRVRRARILVDARRQHRATRAAEYARVMDAAANDIQSAMYETRSSIRREDIMRILAKVEQQSARLTEEELEIISSIQQFQFGANSCITDIARVEAQPQRVLRDAESPAELAVVSMRDDGDITYVHRHQEGRTISFADLYRRRQARQAHRARNERQLQAQRMIQEQASISIKDAAAE